MTVDYAELESAAAAIRGRIIEMSHRARAAHLGSALSCVDILVALYWQALTVDPGRPDGPDRDRLVFSKGHAAAALFATLAARGYFPDALLDTYGRPGSCLEEHPSAGCAPGVEAAAGSLGHGLPMGIGMALAGRIQRRSYRVAVLMSDGECNEGSVWEGAMFAGGQHLNRLMGIVDFNKWQATGRSCQIMALEPLADKWRASGWRVSEIDGHDFTALVKAFAPGGADDGRPLAVIAHTVKGRGVSFMEDDNNWHYRIPTDAEVAAAKRELGLI